MKTYFRRVLYILLAVIVLAAIGIIAMESIIKNKIEEAIANDLPTNMSGSYDTIKVGIWSGNIFLRNPSFVIKNEENNESHTIINMERLEIFKFSFWKYLTKTELHIGNIVLENPNTIVYKDLKSSIKDSVSDTKTKIEIPPVYLDSFKVEHAEFAIYENGKDSTKLQLKNLSFSIGGIKLTDNTRANPIPITYQSIAATSETIFLKASEYENLSIGGLMINDDTIVLNDLNFETKYSKTELSQRIDTERDHYDLSLKSVSVTGYDFGFANEIFFVHSSNVELNAPSLKIFRDKLVADDLSVKPLYSKMLRELPFQLTVDSLNIRDGFVQYQERVKARNQGGIIHFKNMDGSISNLGNTYKNGEKTTLHLITDFMDQTPFSASWSFDVQNPNDEFVFEGKVGRLIAEKMDPFTKPNLNVSLEGFANETYFTIDGNNNTSQTTMKISYSDFKVNLLRNDGEQKNKVISALVNVLVSKNSAGKNGKFRSVSTLATRDKTKSVFNFLWISVKNALQKSLS